MVENLAMSGNKVRLPVLMAVLVALWGARALADKGEGAKSYKELIWLAIDKTTLRADLQTLPGPGEKPLLLHQFRIAIGKKNGDKVREGDNRTPEGVYFAQNHIDANKLLISKYGRRAIPLDFPNPVDRIEQKTGHGIWLHGAGDDGRIASAKVTEGCVAFYNADILRLKSWVRPYQSLVVIAKDLNLVNRPVEQKEVVQVTRQWLRAWEDQDIERYIGFYSRDFRNGSRNRKAYYNYKKRVFKSYNKISINTSVMRVITHPKYAVTIMNQDFRGDRRFRSVGRKVLYWRKEAGAWHMIAEKFGRTSFVPMGFSGEDVKKLSLSLAGSEKNQKGS